MKKGLKHLLADDSMLKQDYRDLETTLFLAKLKSSGTDLAKPPIDQFKLSQSLHHLTVCYRQSAVGGFDCASVDLDLSENPPRHATGQFAALHTKNNNKSP